MLLILHKFKNAEYGITSKVYRHVDGFSVAIFDDDAEQTVPVHIICKTESQAIKKAKELVA